MFTLRDKKEVLAGLNYGGFLGYNAGYSSRMQETNFYYRLDFQTTKRFYNNTSSNPHDSKYYSNLKVKSLVINNSICYRFFQKKHDWFYFDLGAYLGINLWQEKKGQTKGYYQIFAQDFNKTYYLLPNDFGMHLGFGQRLGKHILLKPELRIGLWNFDKLFEDSGFLDEMMMNLQILPSFNVAYMF